MIIIQEFKGLRFITYITRHEEKIQSMRPKNAVIGMQIVKYIISFQTIPELC